MATEEREDIIHDNVGNAGEPIHFELLDCDGEGRVGTGSVQESTIIEILKRRGFLVLAPGTFVSVVPV
jgi:hypothetical protein